EEAAAPPAPKTSQGTLIEQTLERPLRPGEVSLDELERAFRETEIELLPAHEAPAIAPAAAPPKPARAQDKAQDKAQAKTQDKAQERAGRGKEAKAKPAGRSSGEGDLPEGDKVANQSIGVNVDTLEPLMTMVPELVLPRNQFLEISRRNEDTEFK